MRRRSWRRFIVEYYGWIGPHRMGFEQMRLGHCVGAVSTISRSVGMSERMQYADATPTL